MKNSFIELIYDEVADQTIDENPMYCPEARDLARQILKNYSNKENLLKFESDLTQLQFLSEHSAFIAGFKTAMKFMQEVAL